MILGIGADIVDIRRIEKLIERFGDKFINRIFNEEERGSDPAHYAKRFAGKEAVAKSFGTGIGRISFRDIIITNEESGRPRAAVANQPQELRLHISLSDEYPYAFAMAIAEVAD